MTDEDAFLRAICDQPDEDTPRLAFADWLQEHGQEHRAEFIRVQCERARGLGDPTRRTHTLKRSIALSQQFGREWYARDWPDAGPPVVNAYTFARGFVDALVSAGQELTDDAVARVCASRPLLALVGVWNLSANRLTDAGLAALADCPRLGRLRVLNLSANPVTGAGFERLAASPHLTALAEVVVGASFPPFAGVADLLAAPNMLALQESVLAGLQLVRDARAAFRRHGKAVRVRA
jgi:uncharacterized protein (TIGR02996 family)